MATKSRDYVNLLLITIALSLAIVIMLVSIAQASAATITRNYSETRFAHIIVQGDIDQDATRLFRNEINLALVARLPVLVDLSSSGGEGLAGMTMGMTIREVKASTYVAPGNSCISACVLVWAG